jgi:polysaccharide pyruvyl transferase WcaK-like protein
MSVDKHIVLWGAWYGSRNVGDQILLLTIMDLLNAALDGRAHYTALTADPKHVLAYTLPEKYKIDAHKTRKDFGETVRSLRDCDLFIFGGGAPFFEQTYQVVSMAVVTGLLRLFRKPYLLWVVSSQEVHSSFARLIFRWVLAGATAITVRDDHTRALFEACGVDPERMTLIADSGFTLRAENDQQGQAFLRRAGWGGDDRPLVALTPRTLRSSDGEAETHYNPKTQSQYDQELECFSAAADWLWEHGYQPIFVPMNTVAPDDDRLAAKAVMARARYGAQSLLIDEAIPPRTAPAIYRQCRASFVARVHGSVTSAIAACPMMMYAFAPKHIGMMQAMQMEAFILREQDAHSGIAVTMLEKLLAERADLQKKLSTRLQILQQNAGRPAEMAKKILFPGG